VGRLRGPERSEGNPRMRVLQDPRQAIRTLARPLPGFRVCQPDRVPIFELSVHPYSIKALTLCAMYTDFPGVMGLDRVLTSSPSSLYWVGRRA
jgi:hypothetical protein